MTPTLVNIELKIILQILILVSIAHKKNLIFMALILMTIELKIILAILTLNSITQKILLIFFYFSINKYCTKNNIFNHIK
jgi:hypothetical protein